MLHGRVEGAHPAEVHTLGEGRRLFLIDVLHPDTRTGSLGDAPEAEPRGTTYTTDRTALPR